MCLARKHDVNDVQRASTPLSFSSGRALSWRAVAGNALNYCLTEKAGTAALASPANVVADVPNWNVYEPAATFQPS